MVVPAAAERVSQLKLYCRTGVSPRGDQVRTRCGRWLIPLSSMKMIVRPSWRAFFDGGPAHAPPPADLFLVSLAGSSYRPLATPAQIEENLPDMAAMISDAELVLNQVRHPRTSPQGSCITQLLRALQ